MLLVWVRSFGHPLYLKRKQINSPPAEGWQAKPDGVVVSKPQFGMVAHKPQCEVVARNPSLLRFFVNNKIVSQTVFFRLGLSAGFFPAGFVQGREVSIAVYVGVDFGGIYFVALVQA